MSEVTTIETSTVTSPVSTEKLFSFLHALDNYKQLIPEDQIDHWKADQDSCSFTIKNLSKVGLRRKSADHPNKITLSSDGKVPFDFELEILLTDQGNEETAVKLVFNGKINAFMKVMVVKPLRKFFESLVQKTTSLNL